MRGTRDPGNQDPEFGRDRPFLLRRFAYRGEVRAVPWEQNTESRILGEGFPIHARRNYASREELLHGDADSQR